MKTWVKYTVLTVIAFAVGVALGYLTIMINPAYKIDIIAVWNTIVNTVGFYTIMSIIIIIIAVLATITLIRKREKEEPLKNKEKPTNKISRWITNP